MKITTMSDMKLVKVDNWGIYFLQRLKHFFNRTDYCDLTLQFQDNAQLKVHRLVLNACTEYFELLERTCEMYDDCLVMPDDLQADVVVPIVNFMYTGQLEFKMDSLEKLYQTSQIMNMPVLTKLLDIHRSPHNKTSHYLSGGFKKSLKLNESGKPMKYGSSSSGKRSYSKAFESNKSSTASSSLENIKTIPTSPRLLDKRSAYKAKPNPILKSDSKNGTYQPPTIPLDNELYTKRVVQGEPRPTRYELPEELDSENIFENSFSNISYTSKPLMIHPEAVKQYSKKSYEPLSSKKFMRGPSTIDIVECKKIGKNDLFEDDLTQTSSDYEMYHQSAYLSMKEDTPKDSNQLFDQILDNDGPKLTIEGKDKQSGNLDHAKIISEVLKKYPHLIKSNKNIKLKILNSPQKTKKHSTNSTDHKEVKSNQEGHYMCDKDILNSKEAAKLIEMGAENVKGPWICLICGTPGKALNFTTYYAFRRHLVEVHNEKPLATVCEYCGLRSTRRNYLLHHIYTKHGVEPPPQCHFPKCNMCDYVALTEGFLVKHKLTHNENKRCNTCFMSFNTTEQLITHLQKTRHSLKPKNTHHQCDYCPRVFFRESNYYAHIKTNHKQLAIRDGILEDSDDERTPEDNSDRLRTEKKCIKYEQTRIDNEYENSDTQFHIHHRQDGKIQLSKKSHTEHSKQKILNPGFKSQSKVSVKSKVNNSKVQDLEKQIVQENSPSHNTEENIVIIDGTEYIVSDSRLIPKTGSHHRASSNEQYMLSDFIEQETEPKVQSIETDVTPSTSIEFTDLNDDSQQSKMIAKSPSNMNQSIQIVVSNEEEYKALMSSNHSIIFDDGDANKTLTVLTEPHTSNIENAEIDLNSPHANNLMILPDGYPINVSETMSADSKYVVVYSHPVGEQAKEYQIITPHEIGEQFIQDAEVITQSYETVTTTSNSVSETDTRIETQVEETWPSQAQISTDLPSVQLVPGNVVETSSEAQNIEQKADMVVLPAQVEISAEHSIQNSNVLSHDEGKQTNINLSSIDQVMVEEIPNSSIAMDVDMPSNVILLNEDIKPINSVICNSNNEIEIETIEVNTTLSDNLIVENSSELISKEQTEEINQSESKISIDTPISTLIVSETGSEVMTDVIEQSKVSTDTIAQNEILAETVDETKVLTDAIDEKQVLADAIDKNKVLTNTTEQNSEALTGAVEHTSEMLAIDLEPVKNNASNKHIENITSEWSEDEYDTVEEQQMAEESKTDADPALEESIKIHQLCSEPEKTTASKENNDNPKDKCPTAEKLTNREKISSLLHDWDDNDSQEESEENTTNKKIKEEPELIRKNDNLSSNNVDNSTKNNNIKSLVSDWDDDEEEDSKQ